MQSIIDRLLEMFDPEKLIEGVASVIPDLEVAALSFLAFFVVWTVIRRAVEPLLIRAGIDKTARTFIQTTLQFAILAVGTVTALGPNRRRHKVGPRKPWRGWPNTCFCGPRRATRALM